MTTLDLLALLDYEACAAGRAFAAAHPDPFEAIDAALAEAEPSVPQRWGAEFGTHDLRPETGTFLRWAASDGAVLGEGKYETLKAEHMGWQEYTPPFNAACAEALREWVRGVLAGTPSMEPT